MSCTPEIVWVQLVPLSFENLFGISRNQYQTERET